MPELCFMRGKRFSMLRIRIRAHRFAACGARKRGKEAILRPIQQHDPQRWRARIQSFRLLCGFDSRRVVAREIARLQLSYPVEPFRQGKGGLTGHAFLERALRERVMVERAEFRGFATEHPDQRMLGGTQVIGEFEPHLAREVECVLCFLRDLTEWFACSEKT